MEKLDWNTWLKSLEPEDRVVVLIQAWSMKEIAKRKLYDKLLGSVIADNETSEDFETGFIDACSMANVDADFLILDLLAVVETRAVEIIVKELS
jgi:hypothetical protein